MAKGPTSGSQSTSTGTSSGGVGGRDPGDCSGCDPCNGDGVFVECDSSVLGGCACEWQADSDDQDDYEAVQDCPMPSPCPPAVYDLAGPLGTWSERDCLLSALRDRTVGRYQYGDYHTDLAYDNTDWVLLITPDGDVLLSGVNETATVSSTTRTRSYLSLERCTLAEAGYFEACLAQGDGCNVMDDWFVECAPSPAECPE